MPTDKKTPPPLPPDALARPTANVRPSPPAHAPTTADAMPSPWDDEVVSSAPKPVTKSPFGGANWMDRAEYPLVKPEHAEELEQNAAINEFGMKQPRAQAEAAAYEGYKKRQHTEAAAHHLAGMKAAHGAGDMEAARKHSLMYNLHSKAIGHEPVGPAHPDVIAHLSQKPSKVYKFKPHHGDQLALNPAQAAPEAPGIVSSAPAPTLGKNEREALYVVWQASQALQKATSLNGGLGAPKMTVTDKFHGKGKQLGPTVQVDKGKHTNKPAHPRTEPAYRKDEMAAKEKEPKTPEVKAADRGAKASNTTCPTPGCGNYKPYYANTCSECNRAAHHMGKAEMSPRAKGAAPCVCPSYKFPHRHKSGKCGADKK